MKQPIDNVNEEEIVQKQELINFFDEEIDEDIVPTDILRTTDILMRQGQTAWMREHPGTKSFRTLIAYYFDKHNSLGKTEKTNLSMNIVSYVHRERRRFLKEHKSIGGTVTHWKRLTNDEAYHKVASAFRQYRRQLKRRNRTTSGEQKDKENHVPKRSLKVEYINNGRF